MKKLLLISSFLFLTACGSNRPNLVQSQQPILNMESAVAPFISTKLSSDKFCIQNNSEQALRLSYGIFWYDKDGVTSTIGDEQHQWHSLILPAKEKYSANLQAPNERSVNYRLYIRNR